MATRSLFRRCCTRGLLLTAMLLAGAVSARAGVRELADYQHGSYGPQFNDAGQAVWLGPDGALLFWDGETVRSLPDGRPTGRPSLWRLSEGGQVVWQGPGDLGPAIYLWDGAAVQQLSKGTNENQDLQINGAGQVVWLGDGQVYFWDGVGVRLLSAGLHGNHAPQLNDAGQVAWADSGNVYLWDGTTRRQLSHAPPGHTLFSHDPQIDDAGQVAWIGLLDSQEAGVYFWDGAAVQLLPTPYGAPQDFRLGEGGRVAWRAVNPPSTARTLYLWDGIQTRRLTQVSGQAGSYQINPAGVVTWEETLIPAGFARVFLWDGRRTLPLSDQPSDDPNPQLDAAGQVVWRVWEGDGQELNLWDGWHARRITNNAARGVFTGYIEALQINRRGQVLWADDNGGIFLYTPPPPGSVEMEPGTVVEGRAAVGTVTLNRPAPAGGAVVALASDSPAAVVPATVALPEGAVAASFPVTTSLLPETAIATISASWGGSTWIGTLSITHTALASVALASGGLTLTLDAPAPPGGARVTVTNDQPKVVQLFGDGPAGESGTVTKIIPPGQIQAIVTYGVSSVSQPTTVHFSASYGGVTRTTMLSLSPPRMTDFVLTLPLDLGFLARYELPPGGWCLLLPEVCDGLQRVTGGVPVQGLVTLEFQAPPDGLVVALSSDNPAAAEVPATMTVPWGSPRWGFPITTHPTTATTEVHITAAAGGITRTVSLTLLPFGLTDLTVDPATDVGGNPAIGSVHLSAPAPAGGAVISLYCSRPGVGVPPTVVVTPGSTVASFRITTPPVDGPLSIPIAAGYAGAIQTTTLTLQPPDPPSSPPR